MENVKQKNFTLFLDIDGVLHTGTPLFHLLPNFVVMCYVLLERIGYRKIELVISSSWHNMTNHVICVNGQTLDGLRLIALGNTFKSLWVNGILPMGWSSRNALWRTIVC